MHLFPFPDFLIRVEVQSGTLLYYFKIPSYLSYFCAASLQGAASACTVLSRYVITGSGNNR